MNYLWITVLFKIWENYWQRNHFLSIILDLIRYHIRLNLLFSDLNLTFFGENKRLWLWGFLRFGSCSQHWLYIWIEYWIICWNEFIWKLRLFCSNMDLSDHAHIFHTGVFEGEEFNEKSFICRKLTVLEIFESINEFP